ncbi:MAG: glycyl-radical enzyme activating protein [Peptococcaceae bacterium]|nr:glycyl-radical enzyme activating protein [Peptococcaceae bacterium]
MSTLNKEITGLIYDIQGFSVHDGPGIRTTVFLKGCPLRCPWCHSPESQSFKPQICWMDIRCVGVDKCGLCLNVCPQQAISLGDIRESLLDNTKIQLIKVSRELCNDCGKCAEVCSAQALFISGTEYTVEQVMQRLRKDIPFFETSGGGVTISGGEPLSQPAFTLELLKQCKKEGLHTAVDTTGFSDFKLLQAILAYTDLFLYDIKNMDSSLHNNVIGVPNEKILGNALRLAEAGAKIQVRIPLIPLFNDSDQALDAVAKFCLKLGDAVTQVQVLPYHAYGVTKYQRILYQAPVFEAQVHSEEKINHCLDRLKSYGLPVVLH